MDFTDRITVRLPLNLGTEAKMYAQQRDLTLSQLIRRALRRELGSSISLPAKKKGR